MSEENENGATCNRCHCDVHLREDSEHDGFCDSCAHDELAAKDARITELEAYLEHLEWADDNVAEIVCESSPIADSGDYDSCWVVYEHHGQSFADPKRVAIGWGETVIQAIQDARKDGEDPTKLSYIPPEFRYMEPAPTPPKP